MDGVIFDSEQLGLRCWKDVGGRYGLKDIESAARQCIGRSTRDTMALLDGIYGAEISVDKLYTEAKTYMKELIAREGLPVKPGAESAFKWLKEKGWRTALCSSTSLATVRAQLTDAGLIRYFDEIVGGDMVAHSKPLPDIYLLACERLGVRPEHTFAVEDSRNGIISASDAGMMPILVPDLIEPDQEMLRRSTVLLRSLEELPGWLTEQEDVT